MSTSLPLNRCRMCGASSYRPVIDRDPAGAMRATGLFRCCGCSVVFADPRAWREGGAQEALPSAPATASATAGAAPATATRGADGPVTPRAPDWRNYGTGPGVTAG